MYAPVQAHFVPGMRLWEMTQLHTLPTKFKAHCKPNCRTAQDPEAFLAEFWQAGNSSSVLGFKLMRNQLREEQVERLLLRDPGVAKLVLYRCAFVTVATDVVVTLPPSQCHQLTPMKYPTQG